jgi:hypothetical protein
MRVETITEWQERTKLTPKVIAAVVPKPKRKYTKKKKPLFDDYQVEQKGKENDTASASKNRSFAEIRKSIRRSYTATAS